MPCPRARRRSGAQAAGRRVEPANDTPPPPPGPRRPPGGTEGVPAATPQLGSARCRGAGAPASPAPPGRAAGGPGCRARRGGRRSGSLRQGLLLSFGALVCFLKGCNGASIFPPSRSETAAQIPHLRGARVRTQPKPAQPETPEMLLHH